MKTSVFRVQSLLIEGKEVFSESDSEVQGPERFEQVTSLLSEGKKHQISKNFNKKEGKERSRKNDYIQLHSQKEDTEKNKSCYKRTPKH